MPGDAPIIVGGGGSTYLWIRKGLTLTPKPYPQDPPAQYEIDDFAFDPHDYDCYDVGVDLVRYKTHDGDNQGNFHKIKVRRRHCTRFYDAESRR